MSKIILKMDDKTFSAFVPKAIAETRFLELCGLAMKNVVPEDSPPFTIEGSSVEACQPQEGVNIRFVEDNHNANDDFSNDAAKDEPPEDSPGNRLTAAPNDSNMEIDDKEPEPDEEFYRGFLHIVCKNCGKSFSFSAKNPTNSFECHDCGHITKLKNLGRMKMLCECGKTWRYHTNAVSDLVELNCVACHSPMVAQMDKHGDYWPLRES